MQVLESKVERGCKTIAEHHGCILLKIQGAKGWPDRLLLGPQGQQIWMEFKAEGQSLSPLQKHMQLKLMRMGHFCYEVDNPTLFLDLLRKHGCLMSTKSEALSG